MEFIGIIGERGSGKTNLMTRYLKLAADDGRKVICNYALQNIPHRVMSFDELRKLPDSVQDAVIGMDELGVGADSYDFFSKEVRSITSLIAQIRKRHCLVYYTVQRFRMVAKRLRDQTDGFILMEDLDRGKLTYPDGSIARTHREVCDGQFKAVFMNDEDEITNKLIFNGRNYWQYYNTDQIVWG